MTSYHDQQESFTGDDPNQHILDGTNFQETIKMGAIFELDRNYYKVLEDYNSLVSSIQCQVTCSIILTVPIGSTISLDAETVHCAIQHI